MLPADSLYVPRTALHDSSIDLLLRWCQTALHKSDTRWATLTMHWPSFNRRYLFAKRSGGGGGPGCSLPSCNVSAGCCQQSWEDRRKRAFTGLADFKWDTLTSCGYVLAAEVLGTVILIILCVVAANTARQMSIDIDAAALTELAFSDPMALCVNATDSMQGVVLKQTLTLQGDLFEDKEGQVWTKAFEWEDPTGPKDSTGIFSFASPLNENMERISFTQTDVRSSAVENRDFGGNFIRTTIAAMYHCGLITGGYNAEDLPSFTNSQCQQCNIHPQSSNVPELLKRAASTLQVSSALQQLGAAEWSMGSEINQARAKPDIERVTANYTFTLQPVAPDGPFGTNYLDKAASPTLRNATDAMVWTYQDLLPDLDVMMPDFDKQYNAETAVYVTFPAWAWALTDTFSPDSGVGPGWAPPLTYRISVYDQHLDIHYFCLQF